MLYESKWMLIDAGGWDDGRCDIRHCNNIDCSVRKETKDSSRLPTIAHKEVLMVTQHVSLLRPNSFAFKGRGFDSKSGFSYGGIMPSKKPQSALNTIQTASTPKISRLPWVWVMDEAGRKSLMLKSAVWWQWNSFCIYWRAARWQVGLPRYSIEKE